MTANLMYSRLDKGLLDLSIPDPILTPLGECIRLGGRVWLWGGQWNVTGNERPKRR